MTKTEVLLILLGGIFVVEALSVLIQVFAFQTFRKRVFLMAPIHHHFELMGWSETKIILRFWIVAAVCAAIGFTIYQQSIAGAGTRPGGARRCPPGRAWSAGCGPLGLAAAPARTSSSASRARGSRRSQVLRAPGRGRRAASIGAQGDRRAWTALERRARRGQVARACPREAPVIAAARERGLAGARRARARLAAAAQRVHRGHRDQRQDDDDRAARPHPPRGRARRSRSPATSARR